MKFNVTFKTNDVLDGVIPKLPTDCGDPICQEDPNFPCKSCKTMSDDNDAMLAVTDKFIEYGEYITIEFDTKKGTAVAVPLPKKRS
jgi:hypothetical protein